MSFRETTVTANGVRFGALEAGDGPLVLLLHGFPDNAWTWEHQIAALARAGYRTVAPFLRGHPPTEAPAEPFDTETLTLDAHALIEALGEERAYVVGHDWGALATMNLAGLHPESLIGGVAIGAGHPATAIEIFDLPEQLQSAFHVWLFQLEGFGELAARSNDLALVDYLWEKWSAQPVDWHHVNRVKNTLAGPGVIEALLSYYRGLVRIPSDKPEFFECVIAPTTVPTLVVYGSEDPGR
ncbi:MAG: alpha/beta hydrolase, partial [Actinomycetota bacterium]|nr:alpha/beta hydrolase [Actinomycetota bacterium]